MREDPKGQAVGRPAPILDSKPGKEHGQQGRPRLSHDPLVLASIGSSPPTSIVARRGHQRCRRGAHGTRVVLHRTRVVGPSASWMSRTQARPCRSSRAMRTRRWRLGIDEGEERVMMLLMVHSSIQWPVQNLRESSSRKIHDVDARKIWQASGPEGR